MPDLVAKVRRLATSGVADAVVGGGLAVLAFAFQVDAGGLGTVAWTAPIAVVLVGGGIATRRRWPLAAALACAAALGIAGVAGQANSLNGVVQAFLALGAFLAAYSLGSASTLWPGLAGVVLLAAGMQIGSVFNPSYEMITFGPWLAGRVVLSRRQLVEQLEDRNREMEAGKVAFVEESVRYERSRIARELHDIVAHSLSLMVVQASAGQRMSTGGDVAAAAEVFDVITDAADEAQSEIRRLLDMVSGRNGPGLQMVEELVSRVSAAGTPVRYQPSGDCASVPRSASEVGYRVVQESLTNSLKHAPGVPVDVTIRAGDRWVEVEVVTSARKDSSGLERSGAGRGLAGMSQRVGACGGTFNAGPTADGGWQVSAQLPGR